MTTKILVEAFSEIVKRNYKMFLISQVLVAHTCNPSYSEGRDQED
jgi:hypothetical protein